MARKSTLTDAQKRKYAAQIASGEVTYESVARKLGRDSTGLKRLLFPLVEELRGNAGVVHEKIHDAVQSINALPAPLKRASVGLLETMLAALDGDFAKYVKNSTKIALHTSKLAMRKLSEAGANPTPQDLVQVGVLSRIGRENSGVVLEAARVIGGSVRLKKQEDDVVMTPEEYLEARKKAIDSV